MKKLLFILTPLLFPCALKASSFVTGPIVHNSILPDSIRKNIVHPTEAMTDAQLNTILSQMQQKANDAQKVVVLKAGVTGKGILVAQLTQLLNQFLTDASKLDCAEYAYAYTVNYKDFKAIEDLFATEAPKSELEDFLKKNK